MSRHIARWLPVVLALLLAALTYWLNEVVQPNPAKRDGSNRHDPDYVINNFTATKLGPDGTPAYVLTAAKMIHYPDDDSTQLEAPRVTDYQKDRAPLHIAADSGRISKDGKDIYLSGRVKIVREAYKDSSALTVQTTYLHLIPDAGIAETDKPVTIQDAHTFVSGVGLEFNNKTRILKLLSHVKGHYDKATQISPSSPGA